MSARAACGLAGPGRAVTVDLPGPPPPRGIPGRPGVMAILNLTPDSFSDGGALTSVGAAVAAGMRAVADGAGWLDVGGESSRPGALPVPAGEELRRVVPVVAGLRAAGIRSVISVDTTKAEVAAAALEAGADAVNDIAAGADPEMLPLVARHGARLVLMHRQGRPQTMQADPRYGDVVAEVAAHLAERVAAARAAGVDGDRILVDPGIGFGKTVAHNLALLRSLDRIAATSGRPLVLGISRKAFLSRITGTAYPAGDALGHVLHALLAPSCALLRVHDVAGTMAALRAAGLAGGATTPGPPCPSG